MRDRFRTIIWRELPFSARRAIIGTIRSLDDFERALIYFWRNLYYSPAWLFVALSGSIGIVLTILLFISLSRELLARAEGRVTVPRIEVAEFDPNLPYRYDTRLNLEEHRTASVKYDADFAFGRSLPPLRVSRPVDIQPVREPVVIAPVERPTVPDAPEIVPPRLRPSVEMLRHPQQPVIRPEILMARSELEELNTRDVTRLPDGWDKGRNHRPMTVAVPPAYAGDPDLNVAIDEEEDVWSDLTAWPNRADVGLRIELHAPEHAAAGQPGSSHIVIRNDGEDTIRRIQLSEPQPLLPLVTGATPEARLRDSLIDREFRRLRPDRERNLSLAWFARSPGNHQHEARVLAEAVVSATVQVEAPVESVTPAPEPIVEEMPVEVPIAPEPPRARRTPRPEPEPLPAEPAKIEEEPDPAPVVAPPPTTVKIPPRKREPVPAVACRVKPTTPVRVNEIIELNVEVQNTGETPLHNVRIWADVPKALRHRHGEKLEYPVGKLDPGQVHHSVLRVVGQQAGAAVAAFRVVSDEKIRADAKGQVAITAPKPVKPTTIAKPAPKPAVSTPTCPCECQAASGVMWAGYEF